ncbi:MAG TPA: hypothetical protein VGF94_07995 [Kofleriaceae bacterium]
MKKCASCSKDLPEAALHCVFCGAKQPPAPAVQPGTAKTAFGYSANEVMAQLGRPGAQPAAPAYQPPPQQPAPAYQPPPQQAQPQQPQFGGLAPAAPAQAATMFAPGPGGPPPQQQAYQQPPAYQQAQSGAAPMSGGMGIHSPNQHTPQPLPPVQNSPYLGARAARAGVPIEPWKDSLRLMMFIWGAVLLAAFATPIGTDPVAFHWTGIGDMPAKLLIGTLLVAGIGLLGLVLAAIPMVPMPRGIMALVLGLAGIFVPLVLTDFPGWRGLLELAAMLTLVPGLLVRNEYTESMLARILVTIGVLCFIAPLLVPSGGEIQLVQLFKGLIDAPGKLKVFAILELGLIVVVVMSLLAWMPGPATGAAKVFAWLIILWPVAIVLVGLVIAGNIGKHIEKEPYESLMAWAPAAAFAVFVGYGGATVIGKQLE